MQRPAYCCLRARTPQHDIAVLAQQLITDEPNIQRQHQISIYGGTLWQHTVPGTAAYTCTYSAFNWPVLGPAPGLRYSIVIVPRVSNSVTTALRHD